MKERLIETKTGRRITGCDGGFFASDEGIVLDTNTGLEWLAGPDRNTTWDKAKSGLRILRLPAETGVCRQ